MLGKAVKIRHCPATVSASPCVWFTGKVLFRLHRQDPATRPLGV
jgi:hypothetical protein